MLQTSSTRQKISVFISVDLADQYAERALKYGRTVEDEVALHLNRTKSFTSTQPIYLTDADRSKISVILGKLVKNPEELISTLEQHSAIDVQGVNITLDENLLKRLKTRCFGQSLEQLIHKEVIAGLEQFVGLR